MLFRSQKINAFDKSALLSITKEGDLQVTKVELLDYSPIDLPNTLTTLRFMPSSPSGNGELYRITYLMKNVAGYNAIAAEMEKSTNNNCIVTKPAPNVNSLECKTNTVTVRMVSDGHQLIVDKMNDADYQMVVDASK